MSTPKEAKRRYKTKSALLLPETVERVKKIAEAMQISEAAAMRSLLEEGLDRVEARMHSEGRFGFYVNSPSQ